jgi:cytochrome c oxidase cbb3-type subunit 3
MFKANCAVCHAPDGGGRTGPNMTDDSYINIKKPEDFYRIIHDGVLAKGMPEWGKRFSQSQLILLASYVANLRGTTPRDPKAAEGSPVPPWPKVEAPSGGAGSKAGSASAPSAGSTPAPAPTPGEKGSGGAAGK